MTAAQASASPSATRELAPDPLALPGAPPREPLDQPPSGRVGERGEDGVGGLGGHSQAATGVRALASAVRRRLQPAGETLVGPAIARSTTSRRGRAATAAAVSSTSHGAPPRPDQGNA